MDDQPHDLVCSGPLRPGRLHLAVKDPQSPSVAQIDLRWNSWIEPYGLVALAIFIEHQAGLGRRPVVLSPVDLNVANYVSRMGLGPIVEHFGGSHDLPAVRRNETRELLELRQFSDETEVSALAEVVYDKLEPTSPTLASALHQSLIELGTNVPQHARREYGYAAAQTTHGGTLIRFAVGDAGVGLAGSLGELIVDEEAGLEAVMQGGLSSTGEPGRGQGIYSTREHVVNAGGVLFAHTGRSGRFETADGPRSDQYETPVGGFLLQGVLSCD